MLTPLSVKFYSVGEFFQKQYKKKGGVSDAHRLQVYEEIA